MTLSVPQFWSPPQLVTENGDTFHQEREVFLWRSGEKALQMLEENSGGTINMFLPLFFSPGRGFPKAGLEGAGEGEDGKNKSKPAGRDNLQGVVWPMQKDRAEEEGNPRKESLGGEGKRNWRG